MGNHIPKYDDEFKSLFSILKMYYNSFYRHEGAKSE